MHPQQENMHHVNENELKHYCTKKVNRIKLYPSIWTELSIHFGFSYIKT